MKKSYISTRNFVCYTFILALTINLSFSQKQAQKPTIVAKRIEILNPSRTQLLEIKEAGFDLSCGAIFNGNNLIMEVGEQD